MNHVDEALALFAGQYNCAQAVAAAFGPEAGLDAERCRMLAAPFGGGLGRLGETCGAVTGALLVLGLRHGGQAAGDPQAKAALYERVRDFVTRFKAQHRSIICRELLGCDIGTPEGWRLSQERQTHRTVCPAFVRTAAELLDATK